MWVLNETACLILMIIDFILRGHSFDNTSIFHEGLKQ